jgi:cysteine desulfurase / selenocysteine lyase
MREVIYLDNGATSWPKPPAVQAEMVRFLQEDSANPGRAGHRMAIAAEKKLDDVRGQLTRLFDGEDAHRMILTLNCTDALNIAIRGVLKEGDHAITTTLEHNSISRPLQTMAEQKFITLTRVPMFDGGFVDPDAVAKAITPKTRLLAITHCSNVLSTIQPAAEIGRIAREKDVLFLLDAAQSAGIVPISIRKMNIDLLAFPGHKSLMGPTGTGGLYVGPRADPAPFRIGGTGGDSASPTQPHLYPYWLEGGTPNTIGIAGLGAGIDWVVAHDPAATLAHERSLIQRLVSALESDSRFNILGSRDFSRRAGSLAVTIEGLAPSEAGAILDESFNIAIRPGLHCAPYIHKELGTFPDGAVRISPGPFNTQADIDHLISALQQIAL